MMLRRLESTDEVYQEDLESTQIVPEEKIISDCRDVIDELHEDLTKIYFNCVTLLKDGTASCTTVDSEEEAIKLLNCVALRTEENEIPIIRQFICPSDNPEWSKIFLDAHYKKLTIAKQKHLDLILSNKKKIEKINYDDPIQKTGIFLTRAPSNVPGVKQIDRHDGEDLTITKPRSNRQQRRDKRI